MKTKRALLVLGGLIWSVSLHAATLKIATLSPDGSAWMNIMRAAAKEVHTKTNGEVRIKLYPAGVMGTNETVLKKMRIGQLQGAALASGALSAIYPDDVVYSLPAVFHSEQEVQAVRRKIDPKLKAGLDAHGFTLLGIAGGGFTYLMTKHPVARLEQLRKQKMWVPGDDGVYSNVLQTMRVKAVSVPIGDVLISLQTGLLNAVTISPVGALVLQWHTQIKYMTDLPLFYIYGFLVIDKQVYNKLSDNARKVVSHVLGRAMHKIDSLNSQDASKAKQAILDQGVQLVKPKQADIKQWQQLSVTAIDNLVAAGKISQEIVKTLQQALSHTRGQHS